jgi:hypothetical protein
VSRAASEAVRDPFTARTRGVSGYLRRLEALRAGGKLSDRDVTRAYEGAFLGLYTDLERHLEQLFIGLVMDRYTVTGANVRPLIKIRSEVVVRQVVAAGQRYTDWLPYRHIDKRAPAFLAGGRPFDRIDRGDRQVLERMAWIRNAVAHRSSHAVKVFRSNLAEGKGLPPDQRTPAGYLRGQHAPGQTRIEYFMALSVNLVSKLCA